MGAMEDPGGSRPRSLAGAELLLSREPAVIAVRGAVDNEGGLLLQKALLELLASFPGSGLLRVDLSGLSYLSSAGAGALAMAAFEARKRGLELAVRGARPNVACVLELLGFSSFLAMEDSSAGSPRE